MNVVRTPPAEVTPDRVCQPATAPLIVHSGYQGSEPLPETVSRADRDAVLAAWCAQGKPEDDVGGALAASFLPDAQRIAQAIARSINLPPTVQARDLVEEAGYALHQALTSYDPDRESCFTTFLTRVMRARLIDALRRKKWGPSRGGVLPFGVPDMGRLSDMPGADDRPVDVYLPPAATQDPLVGLQDDELHRAIDELPPRERQVILECVLGNREQNDLADEWGLDCSRVSQLKTKALCRLAKLLDG